MKTLILDGSHPDDRMAVRLNTILQKHLAARGWSVERIVLRQKKIGNCAGDFFCWVRTPGVCNVDDDNRDIAAKIVASDLLINLSPVTFGGYSSVLKRMQDHQIQNISPFFTTINAETHHQKRYQSYPRVLAIGWLNAPDPHVEAVFRHLVYRNSLNMYSDSSVCGIVYQDQEDDELMVFLNEQLHQIEYGARDPEPVLPAMPVSTAVAEKPRHAVLLVGSPRTRKSTSAALGGYLFEQLSKHGVETQAFQLYTSLNSADRMQKVFAALDQADLVVLAFPLYVDSLPAPVISALERIAAHRSANSNPTRFAAIANCGFPEMHHNDTALAICAEFASSVGFQWMGSLALGGGQGLVNGVPLNEMDGRATLLKKSLDLAAQSLANGSPIPQSARDLLANPFIPTWMYKTFGGFGWRYQARRYGVHSRLRSRPYHAQKFTR
jgi:multimeric flavodoxin WrbA